MASVEIPGKPARWGNESTNFYQGSSMRRPGSASPFKSYRCTGSFYTHSGDLHVGTKVFNQKQPLDRYGTPSAHKLRMEDQKLPRPFASQDIHNHRLHEERVNPYLSHQNHYSQFSMPTGSKHQRPHSAGPTASTSGSNTTATITIKPQPVPVTVPAPTTSTPSTESSSNLYQSLSKSFYITSYQKQISQPAGTTAMATKGLHRSRSFTSGNNSPYSPLTSAMVKPSSVPIRPLSASSRPQSFSSKSDFLKEVATKYPTPSPQQPATGRTSRPSSATLLKRGSIPSLRN